jgi:hypothetical protein
MWWTNVFTPLERSDTLVHAGMSTPFRAGRDPGFRTRTMVMSSQAAVHSIEALKDFRVALALYGEDTLAALGAVDAEVRRTVHWLEQDRPAYWQEQIKRRREQVASARAEVFRRRLAQTAEHSPSMSEPMANLRRAEASLHDAERRLTLVRKWQPALQHAVLEYHASTRRITDQAAGDVPRAVNLLTRMIDALEAYLRVAPPTLLGPAPAATTAPAEFESIATTVLDEEPVAESPRAEGVDALPVEGAPVGFEPPA